MKLISGSSNLPLATNIATALGIEMLPVDISTFPNGEKRVWIKGDVHGENVTLIQSFSQPVDEHIIETLLLIDALERLGARHINMVIPWLGYSLQDKLFRPGEVIASKVVANLISNSYLKRIFLLDLHNSSTPGFFSTPTEHLSAMPVFVDYINQHFDLKNCIVASPDFGGLKRARSFANHLGVDLVNIDKHRDLQTGEVTALDIQGGDVTDKDVVLFDDVIVSGGTVRESAKLLKSRYARSVTFITTHGLFVGGAFEKLADSPLTTVIVTDSIAHTQLPANVKVISIAETFANALRIWL